MEDKINGATFLLIISIIILGIGYFVVTSVTDSIDGTSAMNNATVSSANTISGIVPLMIMIAAIALLIGIVSFYLSTPQRFQTTNEKIIKIISFLDTTTTYFAYGIFCYAIFGTVALCTYLAYRLTLVAGESGVGIEIGKWILIIVTFYFITAGIGYLFKRFMWNKYKQRKEEQEIKNNMKSLPKGGI